MEWKELLTESCRGFTEIAEEPSGGARSLRKELKGWEGEPLPRGKRVGLRETEEARAFPERAEAAPTVSGGGRGAQRGDAETQTWRRRALLPLSRTRSWRPRPKRWPQPGSGAAAS